MHSCYQGTKVNAGDRANIPCNKKTNIGQKNRRFFDPIPADASCVNNSTRCKYLVIDATGLFVSFVKGKYIKDVVNDQGRDETSC